MENHSRVTEWHKFFRIQILPMLACTCHFPFNGSGEFAPFSFTKLCIQMHLTKTKNERIIILSQRGCHRCWCNILLGHGCH